VSDDPQLLAEREHLHRAHRCLGEMLVSAESIADYGVDALASESLGRLRAERIRQLSSDSDAPAFFGRTDRDPDATHPSGEVFHIGRRHVRDEVGDPVVIDWRAPIARPFYRATPTDRQGVRLRRRFGFADGVLTSFEDERLDAGEALGLHSDLLRAEIERPRVGPMRDIVATIQPDQDELVRADLDTSLCIQGAPGTGKTAVGLHRAAFLLYTYPDRLRRSGVLVVGPNAAFLRYIGQVLPALGEFGIEQTTVQDLVRSRLGKRSSVKVRQEAVEVAVLKGDARLADVLRRAVVSHIVKPDDNGMVALVGTRRYRIPVERLRRYVDDARRAMAAGELRWDAARERLRFLIAQVVRRTREDSGGAPSDAETAKLARSAEVRAWVDSVWPPLDPRTLLVRLFTEPAFLARSAGTYLTEAEQALLAWSDVPHNPAGATFSEADLVLLDELAGLLSPPDQFVHVVVDEAQDLSEMQCRAVGRRCRLGSATVLGDLAQATAPWAAGSWQRTLTHLGQPSAKLRPLTVGYRVPDQVLVWANRLLPHIAPDVPAATSMRGDNDALSFLDDLVRAVLEAIAYDGSVAVIAADAETRRLIGRLASAGIESALIDDEQVHRVSVVPASEAKGLEFDSVVLVEPAAIVAAEPTHLDGLRRLYVTWTRAVSRLFVVHTDPLPVELSPEQAQR